MNLLKNGMNVLAHITPRLKHFFATMKQRDIELTLALLDGDQKV
jgi:hypothetical protein